MTNTTGPLQTMWDTRAPRIPNENGGNALLAGVCEGIGARYRVDPTVVRIAFVVLALLVGGGIFLYLLCWFTMPRISTGSSPMNAAFTPANRLSEEAAKEKSTGWLLLLGMIIFFPSITVGTRSGIAFASLTGLILGFVAWWILHNRTPVPPEGLNIPPAASGPQPQPQPPMGDGQAQAPQPQPTNDNIQPKQTNQPDNPYNPQNNPYAQ